jgi:hypothetical protein
VLLCSPSWAGGGALDFERDNVEWIVIDDDANGTDTMAATGSWTVTAWVNLESLAVNGTLSCIICRGNSAEVSNHNYAIMPSQNFLVAGVQAMSAFYEAGNGANTSADWVVDLTTGVWIFLAAVHDDAVDTLTLFADGVQVAQNTSATAAPDSGSADAVIGNAYSNTTSAGASRIDGMIADARVWGRALSEAELSAVRYGADVGGSMIVWVPLWESGSPVRDIANGETGTVGTTNFPTSVTEGPPISWGSQ